MVKTEQISKITTQNILKHYYEILCRFLIIVVLLGSASKVINLTTTSDEIVVIIASILIVSWVFLPLIEIFKVITYIREKAKTSRTTRKQQ